VLDIAQPKVELSKSGHNYARFIVEPLSPGYGTTLGNALRRILLSSLPGTAITKIRISDVWHEFSTIPHIREDCNRTTTCQRRECASLGKERARSRRATSIGRTNLPA